MEEAALALILEKCMDAMRDGSMPEAAADRYPAVKPEILPLLEVAALLYDRKDAQPEQLPERLQRLKLRILQSPA